MIDIPMKSKGAVDRSTLLTLNRPAAVPLPTGSNMASHRPASQAGTQSPNPRPVSPVSEVHTARPRQIPTLIKPVQKGQKVSIESAGTVRSLKACFGWDAKNPDCDADISAFLLGSDGKVPGDSWFVFYGQTQSPDQSVKLHTEHGADLCSVTIDFQKLHSSIKKIVFVLTIHEAFERKLNFGMMKDAYVRILNADNGTELVSFRLTDYYSNVISMMIGEVYSHNGTWKFNAVGNGVARDLAGLCDLYGVQVND